jgi:hypothetical protein
VNHTNQQSQTESLFKGSWLRSADKLEGGTIVPDPSFFWGSGVVIKSLNHFISVKEIFGHQNIATTTRYAHLSPGFLQEAVNPGSLVETVTSKEEGKEQGRVVTTKCLESLKI